MFEKGFVYPRTSTGASSIVPAPPWHYSGEMLTVEYRTDPEGVRQLLPSGIDLDPDDPGRVALIWADWQSCSDSFEELVDPVRSQYKEAFFVIRCSWDNRIWSRSPFIWVDKDFAIVRGIHQGYPKKFGEIWMTRPITVGRAGPRLEVGGRFGASITASGRRLAEARITLQAPADAPGVVNAHPMLHNRILPAIETDGSDALNELVTMSGYDAEVADIWQGTAEVELYDTPTDELSLLAPQEVLGGWYHRVGVSWKSGTTLRRGNL